MVFMIGTTEEQIKAKHLNYSEQELDKFDGWVRKNGGTIECGLPINDESPLCLEDLQGPVEENWEYGVTVLDTTNDDDDDDEDESPGVDDLLRVLQTEEEYLDTN